MKKYCKYCNKLISKEKLDNWTYSKRVFCNKECYSLWMKTQKHSKTNYNRNYWIKYFGRK